MVGSERCAAAEDTVTDVIAGVAAGATVLGYVPHGDACELRQAGATEIFTDMAVTAYAVDWKPATIDVYVNVN